MSAFSQCQTLERAGFRFYAFGTLRESGRKVAEFYKGDLLTDEMRAKLKALNPAIFFLRASAQYAPEIRSYLVCFPVKSRATGKDGAE